MANHPPPEGYLFSRGYTSYVFLLLWLLYFFDYIDRMVVVSLFPFLKADWGLTDAQCGAMVSAVYWAIVLFSFPTSIAIEAGKENRTMAQYTAETIAPHWASVSPQSAFRKGKRETTTMRSM